MKKRTKVIIASMIISIIIGMGTNKQNQYKKIQQAKEILKDKNSKQTIISAWQNALEKSNFSEREKEILVEEFLPYLDEYYDMYDASSIANLLSATENTHISYVEGYSDDKKEASYSSFLAKIPYASYFTEGLITLDETYTDSQFLHEYYHSIQGWLNQHPVYSETYANFGSDGNYDDLYAIFTMLGYLGDREFLHNNLINGTMENYWNYLVGLYPEEKQLIIDLKDEIEADFIYTYKKELSLVVLEEPSRKNIVEKISDLYFLKYGTSIENDYLFQILVSIYNLDKRYHGENNPLLEDYFVYTFHDNNNTYTYIIDDSNRFEEQKTLTKN